ncbi:hypothetical protein XENOCAPTIV_015923 [Xenoophorus captivus]|uniref:LRRCT domain-containing protein n=1 Tax=Xenoophorus captivus TaxID=1517983 RepID=A0ABV0Q581_9TELE
MSTDGLNIELCMVCTGCIQQHGQLSPLCLLCLCSRSPPGGLSLWLVVWLVLGKPSPASACPHHCVCYPTPMTVSCQAQNFTAVPVGVPYESQRVFLQNNRITELRVGSFGFGTQENNLHFLQDDIFSDLINLSQLFLHGNRIRTLSENVFRGLVNLDRLLLHDNRIRQVNRRAFRDLGRLTMLFLFNNSLAELPSQTLRDTQGIEFLRLNANPWSCGCEARALWEWFREAPVSSSEVMCASPSTRRGQDLRFLREMDFALCPLPDPGSIAGSTTTTFSTKTRWWFHKNKPQSSTKGIFEKSSETVKAGLYGKGPSTTTSVVKYELGEEELALPKLDPEEYWANYGNEDSDVTLRCFELECPPGFDLPTSSTSPRSSSPSLLSLLALSVFTLCLHLLFG